MADPRRQPPTDQARTVGFWHHKPRWCQPWTILLTGGLLLALDAFLTLHFSLPFWLAVPPALAILAWWVLFLLIVPSAAQEESPP